MKEKAPAAPGRGMRGSAKLSELAMNPRNSQQKAFARRSYLLTMAAPLPREDG